MGVGTLITVIFMFGITGCENKKQEENQVINESEDNIEKTNIKSISLTNEVIKLEDGLSVVSIEENDGFTQFLDNGGAKNDQEVVSYLKNNFLNSIPGLLFGENPFGCSTFIIKSDEAGYYFGRNFDWQRCKALIVRSKPENGYASLATVNTDFIQTGGIDLDKLPSKVQALIGIYAPLDGMNEKGLAVSVNMIEDRETISQNTDKKDITTTTAVRLLLNQAANVDEAISLLAQYDMHASMNMMVHFAIADAEGNSVVVEYIDNEMSVTKTDVVTNFYLTEGKKYGIGTNQSHERYEILNNTIKNNSQMTALQVKDVLDSVSKDNFQDIATTEWSIVMDMTKKEAIYYHRENYTIGYKISLEE